MGYSIWQYAVVFDLFVFMLLLILTRVVVEEEEEEVGCHSFGYEQYCTNSQTKILLFV